MTTRFITETKWRVQLQTGAPTLQTYERVLDAPSQEIAIHRASQQYPNVQFVNVTASQLDPQTGGDAQQQNPNTPTATGMLPSIKPLQQPRGLMPLWPQSLQYQQAAESALPFNPRWLNYPYSVSLPAQFARLLKETAPVAITDHLDGRHSVILESATEMREFLLRLNRHRDRKSVNTVLAGIRSSLT